MPECPLQPFSPSVGASAAALHPAGHRAVLALLAATSTLSQAVKHETAAMKYEDPESKKPVSLIANLRRQEDGVCC